MNKSKILSVIEMLIVIAAGVLVLVYPGHALDMVVRIIGIALIVYGAICVIGYFLRSDYTRSIFRLIIGILAICAGIYAIANPGPIVGAFPFAAGLMMIISGVRDIILALQARRFTFKLWKLALAMAAITVLLGIIIVTNPFATLETLAIVLGVAVIYNGIAGLILAFRQ